MQATIDDLIKMTWSTNPVRSIKSSMTIPIVVATALLSLIFTIVVLYRPQPEPTLSYQPPVVSAPTLENQLRDRIMQLTNERIQTHNQLAVITAERNRLLIELNQSKTMPLPPTRPLCVFPYQFTEYAL